MIRRIIRIDEEKCNGCGLCANACHEGAIGMVDGKAKLLRENYCDGLGDCLPACPVNAISFEEREAPAYDEAAVLAAKKAKASAIPCGCPGTQAKMLQRKEKITDSTVGTQQIESQLNQWPVQIKLVPTRAPYFDQANLITMIGCPKLDEGDYAEKLTDIIKNNDIRSVTIVRMEVPCCGGIENAAKRALQESGKFIPWNVVVISTDGRILER